jgi:hypothetical protein
VTNVFQRNMDGVLEQFPAWLQRQVQRAFITLGMDSASRQKLSYVGCGLEDEISIRAKHNIWARTVRRIRA